MDGQVAGVFCAAGVVNEHCVKPENTEYTEWPQKMYTLFTHQYLWNKFKCNFYFGVRV